MVNAATQDQATTKTASGLFGGLTKRVSLVKASVPLKPYKISIIPVIMRYFFQSVMKNSMGFSYLEWAAVLLKIKFPA